MDTVKIVKMIETTLLRKGKGVEGDPIRIIKQYWSMDGKWLFSYDPFLGMRFNEEFFNDSAGREAQRSGIEP